jgi:dTMP kinase
VVVDGVDGCGKSTQAVALTAALQRASVAVCHLRDPGSTPLGEGLRALLLADGTGLIGAATEALLFTAARIELVRNLVAPALAAGESVVCERFLSSTLVYQGHLGGLDPGWITAVNERVLEGLLPDRVVVLDVAPQITAERRANRGPSDRIEARGDGFQLRVRQAFLELAETHPSHYRVIDASDAPAQVTTRLVQELGDLFPELSRR